MRAALLDVNVLIALLWPPHDGHEKAQTWFKRHSTEGWATCPLTQSAFVRIMSNPAFSRAAVTVPEASKLLAENTAHPSHQFWPDKLNYREAIQTFASSIPGHQQVTDSYLLGLALHNAGRLVTMDRGILDLLPANMRARGMVTLI